MFSWNVLCTRELFSPFVSLSSRLFLCITNEVERGDGDNVPLGPFPLFLLCSSLPYRKRRRERMHLEVDGDGGERTVRETKTREMCIRPSRIRERDALYKCV